MNKKFENRKGIKIKLNQIAPLLNIRTVTAKLQQVSILLGKNPIRMVLLSANSPKALASVYIAPKYAMVFLTDEFAGEHQ